MTSASTAGRISTTPTVVCPFITRRSIRLFFFSSRRRHTRCLSDWSSDVALPIYPDVPTAARAMGHRQQAAFTPVAENVETYDRLYAVYRELHDHFGRGASGAMRALKTIRREAHA